MRSRITLSLLLACLTGLDGWQAQPTDAFAQANGWSAEFHASGAAHNVERLLRWNGEVIAAGRFEAIGDVPIPSRVARWRDGNWEPLGGLLPASRVISLCEHDGDLHALAYLTYNSRRVWRLKKGDWTEVCNPFTSSADVMASYGGHLYVGAARFEDGIWVDRLQTNGAVKALVVHDGLLVAGGYFTTGAGIFTGPVLAWDGESVLPSYPGQECTVERLAVWEGTLHASRSNWMPIIAVQSWNGEAWIDLPSLGWVHAFQLMTDLVPGEGRLLACGYWYEPIVKGSRAYQGSFLKAWDGTSGTVLHAPNGMVQNSGNVTYLTTLDDGDGVLVGGSFYTCGVPLCANLGRVVNGVMTPVCPTGLGAGGAIDILCEASWGLTIGGFFSAIAGNVSQGVVLKGGSTWYPRSLDDATLGMLDRPIGLGWLGNRLAAVTTGHGAVVSGYWDSSNIWDGTHWIIPDGYSQYPEPYHLLGWNHRLLGAYYGAVHDYAGFGPPTVFAAVTGVAGRLLSLGNYLVVGGDFQAVGGVTASNLAIYGASGGWQQFGGGLPEPVQTLGGWNNQLVAVTRGPGNDPSTNLVRIWDGQDWNEIGVLTGGRAMAVREYAGRLFIGGYFNSPASDGTPMNGIACWTGSHWQSIGAAQPTLALAVYEDRLWVGGGFRLAGGIPASYLTTFTLNASPTAVETAPAAPISLSVPAPNPFNPRTTITFNLERADLVDLAVFDLAGRRVAIILAESRAAGDHSVGWDGLDAAGRPLPSGTYLLRLRAGGLEVQTKAVLVR